MFNSTNLNNKLLTLIERYGVNHVGVRGRNFAMMYLSESHDTRALRTLLNRGINVHHCDDEGKTLIDYILDLPPSSQKYFQFVVKKRGVRITKEIMKKVMRRASTENKLFILNRCNEEQLSALSKYSQRQLTKQKPNSPTRVRIEKNITLINKSVINIEFNYLI